MIKKKRSQMNYWYLQLQNYGIQKAIKIHNLFCHIKTFKHCLIFITLTTCLHYFELCNTFECITHEKRRLGMNSWNRIYSISNWHRNPCKYIKLIAHWDSKYISENSNFRYNLRKNQVCVAALFVTIKMTQLAII